MSTLHEDVSRAYTEALRKSQQKVAATDCCAPTDTETAVADLAGYAEEAVAYQDSAASSFGCGNPLAFAGVTTGQTVVDLGSGAGLDLLIAADKVGPNGRVIGVDMTDAMIDAARDAAARAGKDNVEVRKGLIEELPVQTASVDWVISNCVINLSPDKPRVFAEIARVLRPNGRFSISDIVVEELPDWIRENSAAYAACVAGAISESEYVAGLEQAGLEDVEVIERLVYDADQIRAMIGPELESLGLSEELLQLGLDQVQGKVWSAKVVGRKRREIS